ncbi:hypothetical protein tb265_05080 [Gemmatimonadetes bacterium T265]|nr:hypothetical protein tb265_05080 [Gemmatimonadetes bacterium T265]
MEQTRQQLPPERASSTSDRRDFLRAAGLGSAALVLAACGAERATAPGVFNTAAAAASGAASSAPAVTLDFSSDIGVLNYAYALEQLEAAFYARVLSAPYAGITTQEMRVLSDLRDHEAIHRAFLKKALGTAAIVDLTANFTSIDFTTRMGVLGAAQAFEDLGVHAYNGAGHYIKSASYLTIAGKIVSVEARHASAIRDLLSPKSGSFAPDVFDAGFPPSQVLASAGKYVVNTINVVNAS